MRVLAKVIVCFFAISGFAMSAEAQTSLFSGATPSGKYTADSAVNNGVRFRSSSTGYILGVKFYKGSSSDNGTHVASLWTAGGTKLASATFTGETASGWQTVRFSQPVAITANTDYVASYWTSTGYFYTVNYFVSHSVSSGSLLAPATGGSTPNGVYGYSSSTLMPTNTYSGTNYWVDVLFSTSLTTSASASPSPSATPVPSPSPTPVVSAGINYYVSTSGNNANNGSQSSPWRTIGYAASKVSVGSQPVTVHVASGTYYEAVTNSASGTSSARLTFISDTKWGAKIVTNSGTDCFTNHGNYVDIVGFDMSGSSANHGVLNYASYVRVMNNHLHNISVPISGGCTNGGAAIDHANYQASHNDTIGNLIDHIGTATSGSCAHGIYMAMAYGKIQNNIVNNVTKWAVTTWHAGTNLTITNNTFFDNHGSGAIQIGQGDAGASGGTNNSYINNNIIYHNAIGIELEGTVGSNNTYANNLMYGNSTNWYNVSGTSASLTGTVNADPMFTNYQSNGSGNYHLTSSSPAINKGTTVGAAANDFEGYARPYGGAFDIGAYEWHL